MLHETDTKAHETFKTRNCTAAEQAQQRGVALRSNPYDETARDTRKASLQVQHPQRLACRCGIGAEQRGSIRKSRASYSHSTDKREEKRKHERGCLEKTQENTRKSKESNDNTVTVCRQGEDANEGTCRVGCWERGHWRVGRNGRAWGGVCDAGRCVCGGGGGGGGLYDSTHVA